MGQNSDCSRTVATHSVHTHMWPHGTNTCVLGSLRHTQHSWLLFSLGAGGGALDDADEDDDEDEDGAVADDDDCVAATVDRGFFCRGSGISLSPPFASRSRFF